MSLKFRIPSSEQRAIVVVWMLFLQVICSYMCIVRCVLYVKTSIMGVSICVGTRLPLAPKFQNFFIGIRFLPYISTLLSLCAPRFEYFQGGGTPIYSVLRSSSAVKMKVNDQRPKQQMVKSQIAFWLDKSQPCILCRIRILYFISG